MDRFAYMLAHVVNYIVGASGWGGCGRAHMRQQFQGRDAVRCYAPASFVETLRADAPTARAPLDFGKMRRSGEAPTLQHRAAAGGRAQVPFKRLAYRDYPAPTRPKAATRRASSWANR